MGNNEELILDLDLNEEPLSPELSLGSLPNELERVHGRIEERIRQLEAVTSRARQRQRWRQRQTTPQRMSISVESTADDAHGGGGLLTGEVGVATQETTCETGKLGKRSSAHLIAKALGMDTDAEGRSDVGRFFDCNICLDMAIDPILTCCGHLFCWSCFYQSNVHSSVKECPVCMDEVTDTSIIPVYGHGNGDYTRKLKLKDCGLKVPPRPRAHRIESMRQQVINSRSFSFQIGERIHQVSNMLFTMGQRPQSLGLAGTPATDARTSLLASRSQASQVLPSTETEDSLHHDSSQVSSSLLQRAASFSSPSSAWNSAMELIERLSEDLEALSHRCLVRRNHQISSGVVDRDSFSGIAAIIHPDSQTIDTAVDSGSVVPRSSPTFRTDGTAAALELENQRTNAAVESNSALPISSSSLRNRIETSRLSELDSNLEINSAVPHSSSSSGTITEFPRDSDVDNEHCHEPRRRRLR